MPIENWVAAQFDELVDFRHDLHQNPELLYDVERTAGRVAEKLQEAGVDEVLTGIGRSGVVGVIRGQSNNNGRMIGLRADMDALPIEEASGKPWSSQVPGKMHACGHDGHTTMLLGAARELASSRSFDGTVIVIFQPAEEGGAGGKAMVDDGMFTRFDCNEVYGMHNMPNLPLGQFAIRPGPLLASVDEFKITLTGVGGHAAFPHLSVDPVTAMGALVQAVQSIVSRNLDPLKSAVVSITSVHGGEAFNVIPGDISLSGTVRTLDDDVRDRVEQRLQRMVDGLSMAFDMSGILNYQRHYPVTVNNPEATENAVRAAMEVAGDSAVNADTAIQMGGEDFSFMLEERPGAMIFAGNGPGADPHHPEYDFNDELIPWGCSYWTTLVRHRLPL
jgi:hippurate hydrolase